MGKERTDVFDEVFEGCIQDSFDMDIPDPSPSWSKMEQILARERAKHIRRKRLQMTSVIAASLLAGAMLLGSPQSTEAFQPVSRLVASLKGDVVTLFYGDRKRDERGALTPPPPAGEGTAAGSSGIVEATELKANTLEEARRQTSTPLPELTYVPEGYELKEIILQVADGRSLQLAKYRYKNGKNVHFQLVISSPDLSQSISLMKDKEKSRSVPVDIRGKQGSLTEKADGSYVIAWAENEGNYVLSGFLTKEDLIAVAEKIK